MTNRQITNQINKIKFANNISKLSYGRTTSCWIVNEDGSETLLGRVKCTSYGVRPRTFSVTNSEYMPMGGGYTLKSLDRKIFDKVEYAR